jgi:hypothetical protein
MAKPNYGFEKRQRDLAKKKKKEEKAQRKEAGRPAVDGAAPQEPATESPEGPAAEPPASENVAPTAQPLPPAP